MFIEVPLLLIFYSFMLEDAVTTNFILYRTCYVLLGYNQTDCALLGTNNATQNIIDLEKKVQPTASVILMTKQMVGYILPILLSFVVGPWSNKHGRKPILLSSFFGFFLAYIVLVVLSLIEWASPWYWLISCIALTLGGGSCSMLAMCFCYVSDVTTEANRNTRMGILEAVLCIGMLLGSISSSYVFSATGYLGIFSICAALMLLSVILIYFFLPESVREVQNDGYIRDLFDLSIVYKSLKIVFKPRPNRDRTVLCLLIAILCIFIIVIFSDSSIFYLYVRDTFHWSLRKYTLYSSANSFLGICGIFFSLFVLNKLLKVKDLTIILSLMVMFVASSIIVGLATADWQIYLAAVLRCLGGVIGPLTRSAISKIIPSDELGNVFSVTTSMEWIAQLVSTPFYTFIYNNTLNTMPNVYNFVSAALYGVVVFITMGVIVIQRRYLHLEIPYSSQSDC